MHVQIAHNVVVRRQFTFPQAWIKPLPEDMVVRNQARRGRFVRSARNAREEAQARFSAIVKENLGPLWLNQALPVQLRKGLCFFNDGPRIAAVDGLVGNDDAPTHLVKITASCCRSKLTESLQWLDCHREIARRQWPTLRAFLLMVDTSPIPRVFGHPSAVGKDFGFKLDSLETAFLEDEIPVVSLRPRDLACFGLVNRGVNREVLDIVEALGC